MSGGVEDVVFRNISVGVAYAAVRVKSVRGRGGFIRNVRYENITADTVLSGVWIDMNYQIVNACTPVPECIPIVENVTVSGLEVAHQVTRLPPPYNSHASNAAAFTLVGLRESELGGIRLEHVLVREFDQAQNCSYANVSAAIDLVPDLRSDEVLGCDVTTVDEGGEE